MAPSNIARGNRYRPSRYPNHPPAGPSDLFGKQVGPSDLFPKQDLSYFSRRPVYRARRPLDDLPMIWLRRTMDVFDQLIHLGESQPSNGTVRKVYRPDGETYFNVAYGNAPDNDLRDLLVWLAIPLECLVSRD